MLRHVGLALILVGLSSTACFAQLFSGTPQEQAACRPDVARMCRGVPPDQGAMLDCLIAHQDRLSKPCRAVLESHGQIQPKR